jgi:hypothetical protein
MCLVWVGAGVVRSPAAAHRYSIPALAGMSQVTMLSAPDALAMAPRLAASQHRLAGLDISIL